MDVRTANVVWTLGVAASLACGGLSAGLLLGRRLAWDTAACSLALLLSLAPVVAAQLHSQTVGLLLALASLTLACWGRRPEGLFAALAALAKPIMAVPALTMVLARHWQAVGIAAVVGGVAVIASIALLGADDWLAYLRQDYLSRVTPWEFTDDVNQSLLSVLMRGFGAEGMPWEHPVVLAWYAGVGGAMAAASLLVAARAASRDPWAGYGVLLLAALLLYPSSMESYGVLILVPLAIEISRSVHGSQPRRALLLAGTVAATSAVGVFACALLMWVVVLGSGWRAARR
jgi:hypothetical protein